MFDFSEFAKFQSDFERKSKIRSEVAEKVLKKEGAAILAQTKRRTPVDTGALRNSWEMTYSQKGNEHKITFSNPQDYASYIEFGTKKIKPFYMNTVPLNKGLKTIENKYQKAFDKVFSDGGRFG